MTHSSSYWARLHQLLHIMLCSGKHLQVITLQYYEERWDFISLTASWQQRQNFLLLHYSSQFHLPGRLRWGYQGLLENRLVMLTEHSPNFFIFSSMFCTPLVFLLVWVVRTHKLLPIVPHWWWHRGSESQRSKVLGSRITTQLKLFTS